MPEVAIVRIMVASEPAWHPLEDSRNVAEALYVYQGTENSVGGCNLCWDSSLFRNLIHFLVFSLPKNGEQHFSYRVVIKLSRLNVKKMEEPSRMRGSAVEL